MKSIKQFIYTNRHFFILLYYFVILFAYHILNKTTVPKYYMYHPIDQLIPFVPIMVVPYVFWYLYITVSLAYLGFACKQDFYRLALFMFGGMSICFILYVIFPNGQNLRPVITHTDIFSKLISIIYAADRPTNSAPSMHVIDSIAVFIAVRRNETLKKMKKLQIGSTVATVLIIMSTVMIKQHSILDVVYGILMSLVLFLVIYRVRLPISYYSSKEQVEE